GSIEEIAVLIVLIVRAVDIAVPQRQFQVRRDLAAPLAGLAILLGRLDRLLDAGKGLFVAFRDQAGHGILLVPAVAGLRFPDIRKGNASPDDHLRRIVIFLICHIAYTSIKLVSGLSPALHPTPV